jgi:hypothetical protein
MLSTLFAGIVWSSAAFEDWELESGDFIQLLQVKAKMEDRTAAHLPVSHHMVFDQCAGFGGASDIIGTGSFTPQAEDTNFEYCRCWGDTHCNAVPFDPESQNGETGTGHYQYDGPGASRFAKAADGSWEIQIFQCGNKNTRKFNPSGQVGVAVKAGGTVVEVGTANADATKCYVNGELKPAGYEVHLPTGFHFKCPENKKSCERCSRSSTAYGTFCAVKDGQFVTVANHWEWGTQINQVLAVPKTVSVQEAGTVCYDSSQHSDHRIKPWEPQEISTTSIVSAEEVIFSQTLIDYMTSAPLCLVQDPPQSGVDPGEPADAQQLCNDRAPGAWQHAQDNCAPLQEQHPSFYNDCLVDECVRADDGEESVIEEIAESDEGDDEASALGDPHMSSSAGAGFDLDPSMLKPR